VCAITGKEDEIICIGCCGVMKQDDLEFKKNNLIGLTLQHQEEIFRLPM